MKNRELYLSKEKTKVNDTKEFKNIKYMYSRGLPKEGATIKKRTDALSDRS